MSGLQSQSPFRAAFRLPLVASGLCALLMSLPAFAASQFGDPLDTPADMRTRPAERPLMAVAHAGERLVAVGPRGLIVVSDDRGKTWTQAHVPVQSDLLAVHFPDPQQGWAVGHEGVILHTTDGGKTWAKQLDGRDALAAFKAYYAQGRQSPAVESAVAQLELNYRAGPALPWLDVWFEDVNTGYAVGSFGMLIATRDGGKTWEPRLDRIDNDQYLNLNAIRGVGGELYIAGERGKIYRLDRAAGHFVGHDTGYIGSFFGIAGRDRALIAFGLRGVVYRSDDHGASWRLLPAPSEQTVATGISMDGSFILGNVAGQVLRGAWTGEKLTLSGPDKPMRMTGMAALDDGSLVLTGLDGVRVLPQNATPGGR